MAKEKPPVSIRRRADGFRANIPFAEYDSNRAHYDAEYDVSGLPEALPSPVRKDTDGAN